MPPRPAHLRIAGRRPAFERFEDRLALDAAAGAADSYHSGLNFSYIGGLPIERSSYVLIPVRRDAQWGGEGGDVTLFAPRGTADSLSWQLNGTDAAYDRDGVVTSDGFTVQPWADEFSASGTSAESQIAQGIERIPVPPPATPAVLDQSADSGLVDLTFAAGPAAERVETLALAQRQVAQRHGQQLADVVDPFEPAAPVRESVSQTAAESIAPRAAIFEVAAAEPLDPFARQRDPAAESDGVCANRAPFESEGLTATEAVALRADASLEAAVTPVALLAPVAAVDQAMVELAAFESGEDASDQETDSETPPLLVLESRRAEAHTLAIAALLLVGRNVVRRKPRQERRGDAPAVFARPNSGHSA